MKIEDLKIGKTYKILDLDDLVQYGNDLDLKEFGGDIPGQFIYQIFDEKLTYTFILDSIVGNHSMMKLVYIG